MKAIILAAGIGSRLKKYTEALPKGMLPLAGKSIIEREIDAMRLAGVTDITLVVGFAADKVNIDGVKYVYDLDWENPKTNITNSLFYCHHLFDGKDDVLVAYADTVHEPRIITKVINDNFALSKSIDVDYKDYWTARNGSWLEDSESCTLADDGSIVETGEDGVIDSERLHGRDASLTFIRRDMAPLVLDLYRTMHQKYGDNPVINGKSIRMMNMSNLLQSWINNGWTVMANKVKRGWMEFDTNEDYEHALTWSESGKIKDFINLDL
jgi:choline kinase